MKQLYKPIAFSPIARLTQSIGAGDVVIPVDNVAAFPDAPSLATIGVDDTAETILYTAKTENSLSGCTRGVEGEAKTWNEGDSIGRNFTAKDHADIIANLQEFADHAANTENPHNVTAADVGAVPTTRTVNTKPLSDDVTLTAADVGAVPTTRTVNTKPLSDDVTLTAADVGAVPTTSGAQGQFLGFTATNTIGAVDAPKSKRIARFIVGTSTAGWTAADCDYLCDGTDDHVEINAAIQALPANGGVVVILDGTYNITANVILNKENTTLSGNGFSTILKDKMIEINSNSCKVSSLKTGFIYCKSSNNIITKTMAVGIGIYFDTFNNIVSENLLLEPPNARNPQGISCGGSNAIVTGNLIKGYHRGIEVSADGAALISNNIVLDCTYAGIEITTNNCVVTSNSLTNNRVGILVTGHKSLISGNRIDGYEHDGIQVFRGKFNIVSENNLVLGNGASSDYVNTTSVGKRPIAVHSIDSLIANNISIGKEIVDNGTNNTLANNKY